MWLLPVLGYVGLLLGFAFLTLAIASGLYYLSELVEEHTVFAKKFLARLIYAVVAVQVLLVLVDGLPWVISIVSIGSQVVYLQNLRHFPIVRLSDPIFLTSCRTPSGPPFQRELTALNSSRPCEPLALVPAFLFSTQV